MLTWKEYIASVQWAIVLLIGCVQSIAGGIKEQGAASWLFGATVGIVGLGGIGRALLLRSLAAMRAEGYAYAVIGGVGPQEFYKKCVGAMLIPDSVPGIYRDFLGGMKE